MKIKHSVLAVVLCITMLLIGCGKPTDDNSDVDNILAEMRENPFKYITLGQYKGLEVEVPSTEVTEDDIQAEINSLLNSNTAQKNVYDRAAQIGDTVVIDFEGYVDDVKEENACAEDYEITLGNGGYIDGFEDGIAGNELNTPFTLNLSFPETYYENLAGKPVRYEVTITQIRENIVPELTDDFIASVTAYPTIEEYKASLNESIKEEKEDEKFNTKLSNVWDLIVDNATIVELPTSRVQGYVDEVVNYYTSYAESANMTLNDLVSSYFGLTEESFRTEVEEEAELSVKSELVVYAIAKTENIELSDEEYTERMATYLANFGYTDIASMENDYGRDTLEVSILRDIVYEYVVEQTLEKIQ